MLKFDCGYWVVTTKRWLLPVGTQTTGKIVDLIMTVKHVRLTIKELPNYVKEGIKRGQEQARNGSTKSTQEVMQKYKVK